MDRAAMGYWDRLATAFRFRPPLTPSPQDIAWCEEHARSAARPGFRGLLLGVTPAIAGMRWPEGAFLSAVDWSAPMIRNVWPRPRGQGLASAVRGDWRELPLSDGSCDIAFCDQLFPALASAKDGRLVLREVRRVLRVGGELCIRAFIRPDVADGPEKLFAALKGGNAGDLLVFRWRLAAAIQESFEEGVAVGDVWSIWNRNVPDPGALSKSCGYSDEDIGRFERWRGLTVRFAYPTLAELTSLAAPGLELVDHTFPAYGSSATIARLAFRAR